MPSIRVMGELERDKLRLLLREIADILSPRTAGEHVKVRTVFLVTRWPNARPALPKQI